MKRTVRRVVKREVVPELVMTEPVVGRKSVWDKFGPLMMVVIVVMAFALGAMWNKVKNAGSGGPAAAGAGGTAAKYPSFKKAVEVYSKDLKLDAKKLDNCVQSGSKEPEVAAEEDEGSKLGVQGTPGFFINGRFVGGAFPLEAFKEIIDKELAGTGSDDVKAYSQTLQSAASQGAFIAVPKQVNVGSAPVKGPASAKVVIVEYSDAQCPFCERAYQTFKQVLSDYGDQVQFSYKQFPLKQIHPNAQKASEVLLCAKDQGKFWEMHDKLFETQNEWASAPSGWN